MSVYSDGVSEGGDSLPWLWRVCTRLRIQEAYDFCLTVKPSVPSKKEEGGDRQMLGVSTTPAFDVEHVLAAVGLPSAPTPARRVPLSGDLFEPKKGEMGMAPTPPPELSDIIPKVVRKSSKERIVAAGPSAPLMKLPYPFTGYGAQASSKEQIPFPPSPGSRKEKRRSPTTSSSDRQQPTPEHTEDDEGETEEEEEEEGAEEEGEEEVAETGKEESSDAYPRTSGSMSSLGQPIMSRYPFQFRRPHARGGSASHSTPQSDGSSSSNSPSSHSQSTRNGETSSEARMSPAFSSSVMSSPGSGYLTGSPIPMPPRHPQPGRGRARAGTVPTSFPTSPSPVLFPGRIPSRLRSDSQNTENLGSGYESFLSEPLDEPEEEEEEEEGAEPQMMEQPEPEGPHEAAEGEDSVGLLGVMPRSPRSSNVSSRRRRGRRDSRTGSHASQSRSDSLSASISSRSRAGSAVRSRAQSLIQSLGAASRSSIELVQSSIRSRTNSMARLEEDHDPGHVSSSDSRSQSAGSASASEGANENYTFGHPIRVPMGRQQRRTSGTRVLRPASSAPSISAPSVATTSAFTARPGSPEHELELESESELQRPGIPIPIGSHGSRPDISTAAQSFITAPATLAGTSDSSEQPQSWAEHMVDRPHADFPGSGFVGPH